MLFSLWQHVKSIFIVNKPINIALLSLAILTLAGCRVSEETSAQNTVDSSPNSPILSDGKVPVADNFRTTTVLQGLERPWAMAWLPDGNILITERPGRLRLVRNGVLEPQAILGVPEVFAEGQGGLMDVAIHPNFAENSWVYLTYAHGDEFSNRTRLARATFNGTALENLSVIFEVNRTKTGTQHFGSRIVWLPDNTMLLAIGDGGNPPLQLDGELIRKQAQNFNSNLGKVLRLNDDGSIPDDNPFPDSLVWSYGHRNIQGMTLNETDNRIWSTEHGARGGDELNLLKVTQNYGWPEVTYSREYSGGEITSERSREGMVDPKLVWSSAIAPSGLAIYTSDRFPQWQGDLFAGGLVSRDVRRIDLDETGNILSEESIPIGQRVRDVRQGADGMLYVLTDEPNGSLIAIEFDG